MDTLLTGPNLALLVTIGLFVAIGWSLYTIYVYMFGERNPLEHNTLARIEAAQNPANLMNDWRRHQHRRRLGTALVIVVPIILLWIFFPDEAMLVTDALGVLAREILAVVQASAATIAERIGSS